MMIESDCAWAVPTSDNLQDVLSGKVAGDYLRKGSKVAIVGRLEIEQWNDRSSGELRSKPVVLIDRLELCGGSPIGAAAKGAGVTAEAIASSAAGMGAREGQIGSGAAGVSEEEVPF